VEQTYDNATKVVRARSGLFMGMLSGAANLGRLSTTDFIEALEVGVATSRENQDTQITQIVDRMVEQKRGFWSEMKSSSR
jgi:hypothetical protein